MPTRILVVDDAPSTVLTARADKTDKIVGLTLGVDDAVPLRLETRKVLIGYGAAGIMPSLLNDFAVSFNSDRPYLTSRK